MISLDQILLLEQKVESAVKKIQQLQSENDALRKKCAELTNALSTKTEQLSTFETDQSQIEDGIKKALDRLNSIENSFFKTVDSINRNSFGQADSVSQKTILESEQNLQNVVAQNKEEIENPENPAVRNVNFNDMDYLNDSDGAMQNQTDDYSADESLNDEENLKNDLFEKNQNETEIFSEQSADFSGNFEENQISDNSPDENSDDDLGFDIF